MSTLVHSLIYYFISKEPYEITEINLLNIRIIVIHLYPFTLQILLTILT